MKKLLVLICLLTVFIPIGATAKNKEKINVYVFYGETCPHCHAAFEFFDSIQKDYGKYFELKKYETWGRFSGRRNKLMRDVYSELGPDEKLGVPYIVIGERVFLGYSSASDEEIKQAIVDAYNDDNYFDFTATLINEMHQETILRWVSVVVLSVILIVNVAIRAFTKRNN